MKLITAEYLIFVCTILTVSIVTPITLPTTLNNGTTGSTTSATTSTTSTSMTSMGNTGSTTTSIGTATTASSALEGCDNDQCIKNFITDVRGAVISAVDNLILIVESEHLPLPPACPINPNCGLPLPNITDFFDDNCTC